MRARWKTPASLNLDLVEKFSHLNVRDETRSKGSSGLQSHAVTIAIGICVGMDLTSCQRLTARSEHLHVGLFEKQLVVALCKN